MAAIENFRPTLNRFSRSEWQIGLTACVAIIIGYIWQDGWPGSAMAIPIAGFLAALVKWRMMRRNLAILAINVVALIAVAIEPGPLNLAMMWLSIAGLVLIQQGALPGNVITLGQAALMALAASPLRFLREIKISRAVRNRARVNPKLITAANLLLPLLAITVFGLLLMVANPLIETAVFSLSWGNSPGFLASWMPIITIIAIPILWTLFKMKAISGPEKFTGIWQPEYFKPAPVIITLLFLNGMFLTENILDLRYVWSGISLPSGMSYADYVHRGSYALIATALLAGALVIFALQPASRSEASAPVRWLVYFWTFQNVFLVASAAKRTLSYIDAYGMTLWRLSGLIWMGLVGLGLALIMARVIMRQSNIWLVNANLGAAFAVLLICGLIDFKGVVANWNVERAIAQIAAGPSIQSLDIDIDYLRDLGSSALPAIELLGRATPADRSIWTRSGNIPWITSLTLEKMGAQIRSRQINWRTWTLRGRWIEAQVAP
jgi:MFS family permease